MTSTIPRHRMIWALAALLLATLASLSVAPIASAGQTPAIVKDPSTGRQTVFYVNSSNEIAFYYSHPSLGWVKGVVGGSVKPGTSPTVTAIGSNQYVYYVNSSGQIANWTFSGGKWIGPTTFGGTVAENSSPWAIVNPSTNYQYVYYVNGSGEINSWSWTGAWSGPNTVGGKVAANTSPTVALAGGNQYLSYVNSSGEIASFTFSGGTSTGKVVNDWCAIRAAVPENTVVGVSTTLNPYCRVESPFQTSFNGQASYIIPKFDVLLSTVYRDRVILNGTPNNASTDQLAGSLPATFTYTATDATGQAIAAQIGRPLTGGPFNVNVITPGTFYPGRNRQLDLSFKKILRFGGQRFTGGLDIYNVMNKNTILFYNTTLVPNVNGFLNANAYMNPRVFRLAAEYSW